MLLILLESPSWVRFNEGDLENFRPKVAKDVELFSSFCDWEIN